MKTNRVMTFGITELLPLLSDAARKEILELAERKHLELAGNPTLPKLEDILPEWHSEICAAAKTITDHISITVISPVTLTEQLTQMHYRNKTKTPMAEIPSGLFFFRTTL